MWDVRFSCMMMSTTNRLSSTEANSLQGKISNESPVGQALIGKKVGDVVDVETPAGNIRYTVLKIERSI